MRLCHWLGLSRYRRCTIPGSRLSKICARYTYMRGIRYLTKLKRNLLQQSAQSARYDILGMAYEGLCGVPIE